MYLESGALDHSAILTADPYSLIYSQTAIILAGIHFYLFLSEKYDIIFLYVSKIGLFRCITNFPVLYLLNWETANKLIDFN